MPLTAHEATMQMLTFGLFIVGFLSVIIAIVAIATKRK
ncbi:putative holin-like toxin [Aneurinibacillus sp. REN35]